MSRRLAIALSAFAISVAPAAAQNFALDPTYGETSLANGFGSYSIDLVAGGDLFASEQIGGDCFGLISDAPQYRLQYEAGSDTLAISAISLADTTLVVNDPSGNWVCNDDFQELNPAVFIDAPVSGQYDIWVGTFGETADATLYFDEYDAAEAPAAVSGAMMPDFNLEPTFGSEDLPGGFGSHSIDLVAGGEIDAYAALGDISDYGCVGNIAEAPDFRFNYTGSGPLTISVTSVDDTTLVVNDPTGAWNCDDDSVGFDPEVFFASAMPGQYDVWVGTFGTDLADATLTIAESGSSVSTGGTPDFSLDPTFGESALASGFTPVSVDLIAGGDLDAQSVGSDCWGSIATAPDYRVQYDGGGMLIFAVESDEDTTLVINAPDAAWYCGDDSGDSFNPEVVFDGAMAGQYDIWVGTFFSGTADATLQISAGSTTPQK